MKVLVVGCERSGTTIISSLLSESSKKTFLNDPPSSWYIYPLVNIIGLRGFTLKMIFQLWKYDIVKIPGFVTILNQLRIVHFKKFKVIYVVRDPRDNIAAIKERLKEDMNGLYLNIHYLDKKGISVTDNLLKRWVVFLERALKYKNKYPKDIIFVKYEDFLLDKVSTIREVSNFCNLNFDESLIQKLKDKQINKKWSSSIKGANRYLNDLDKNDIDYINEVAKDLIEEFDY